MRRRRDRLPLRLSVERVHLVGRRLANSPYDVDDLPAAVDLAELAHVDELRRSHAHRRQRFQQINRLCFDLPFGLGQFSMWSLDRGPELFFSHAWRSELTA